MRVYRHNRSFNVFVVLIVGLPVVVLMHETGHALALVAVTKKSTAKIYLGDFTEENTRSFRIGRIHYHIIWGMAGTCYVDGSALATKYKNVMITLGGPLMSLALTFIFFLFFYFPPFEWYINYFFTGMFWLNLGQFIFTIIPIKYPSWWGPYGGSTSDGYKALEAFKRTK